MEQADEQTNSAPISEEPGIAEGGEDVDHRDPTFRIGSLPAANKRLIVVDLDASVSTAITKMYDYGISQLPVMQGEREVKGVVTLEIYRLLAGKTDDCSPIRSCSGVSRVCVDRGCKSDDI